LDSGKFWRHLLDGAGVTRQQLFDRGALGTRLTGRDHVAISVVGIALLAPAHGEAIDLPAVHDERNSFGRLAERNRQAARSEWIERAGVTRALAFEQPLDRADGLRRRHADRLIKQHPAVDVVLLAAELLWLLLCGAGRWPIDGS